jgi:uncharacterized circularly permuted ATP-grasp superfamily protein
LIWKFDLIPTIIGTTLWSPVHNKMVEAKRALNALQKGIFESKIISPANRSLQNSIKDPLIVSIKDLIRERAAILIRQEIDVQLVAQT